MTPATSSSRVDSIRHSLVGLKMPRALEMLDATLRRIEQGQVDGIEALDDLLLEERSLRESRRIRAALLMARLPVVKTLAGFDFSFQPSLDRNRILALAGLDFSPAPRSSICSGHREPARAISRPCWPSRRSVPASSSTSPRLPNRWLKLSHARARRAAARESSRQLPHRPSSRAETAGTATNEINRQSPDRLITETQPAANPGNFQSPQSGKLRCPLTQVYDLRTAANGMDVPPRTRNRRIFRLPFLVIRPKRGVTPVECCRGTNPSQAAKCRALLNTPMSTTVAAIKDAVIGPMPGIVARRRAVSSCRA